MNSRKYIVKQLTQKSHPQLALGLQQKQAQQTASNKPLTFISIRADPKLLKQMVQIIHNNPQIWLDSSVNLGVSTVVLKQQLFFYNEDTRCFTKINKFQQDVDFKKMQGQSNYKINVQKTKIIRKNHQNAENFANERRALQMEIAKLRAQKNNNSIAKEKYRKQLQIANAIANKVNNAKVIAAFESKQKDLKGEILTLKNKLQQQKKRYNILSTHLDQNILRRDYEHMKSTLQKEIQQKQNLSSQIVILKTKLQQNKII